MRLIDSVLTDDHRAFAERADAFATEVVAPRAEAIEASDEFPRDVLEAAGDAGLLGVLLPEAYGGEGADFLAYCLIAERIARESAAVAESIQGQVFAALPIARHGTEAQREAYLPALATGESVGAMLLTEPGAGSSPSGLETTAEVVDDGYRLAGEKAFGTNAGVADVHLVVARVRPAPEDSHGVSVFLVPGPDAVEGLTFERAEFMGMRGHVTGDSTFDGVSVPASDRLGEVGEGFRIAMGTIDMARTGLGAIGVGIARAAFDAAVDFAGHREQGGQPVGAYQAVQLLLADMEAALWSARALVYESATALSTGDGDTGASALAKWRASEAAESVTRDAIQVLGGRGYRTDRPLERYYRDAKLLSIIGGTTEIQRTTVARERLGL